MGLNDGMLLLEVNGKDELSFDAAVTEIQATRNDSGGELRLIVVDPPHVVTQELVDKEPSERAGEVTCRRDMSSEL
eukprot:SAG11_NODE_533_length_8703_cov_7.183054_8_plen_76_part_00